MRVIFTNHIRIYDAPASLVSQVKARLTMENPALALAKRQGRTGWGVAPYLYLYTEDYDGALVCPRGFARDLLYQVRIYRMMHPLEVFYEDRRMLGKTIDFGPWPEGFALRDYQEPFVQALIKENGLGVSPAGSGKTIMGLKLVSELKQPTVWLTHTRDLMLQSGQRAQAVLPAVGKIGYVGDGKQDFGDRKLIICMVQTLQKHPELIRELNTFVGCVIIDEAHHFPSSQFLDVGAQFAAARFFGLTATPERKDGMTEYMRQGIGPVLYQVDRDVLYQDAKLVLPEVKFVYTSYQYGDGFRATHPGEEPKSVDAGGSGTEYREYLDDLLLDPKRQDLIAEHIVEGLSYGQTIVLGESVRYCFVIRDKVDALLRQKRISARTAVIHGGLTRYAWQVAPNGKAAQYLAETYGTEFRYQKRLRRWQVKVPKYTEEEMKAWRCTKKMRQQILDDARAGTVDILFATQLAREGLDLPGLCVGHTITPKRGDSSGDTGLNIEQEIGRIMRPDPSNPKKKAVWYDYVDDSCGFFQSQYYSRRKVYKRLGIKLSARPRRGVDEMLKNFQQFL